MAENKKSFVAYCEWAEVFETLTDEEAGKLAKHLFRYVNDKNPDAPDRITEISFIPIKQVLKRDLKKYETYIVKQKSNGLKGGRPKAKETQITQPFISEPKKADNDNDNDNDNVNVNVNVIINDDDGKEKNFITDFNQDSYYDIKLLYKPYLQNNSIIDALLKNKKYGFESKLHIRDKLREFVMLQTESGTLVKTPTDFAKHFRNWIMAKRTVQTNTGLDKEGRNASDRIPIG